MKPIETPAWRPTASSIWNIFQSSGKRHLLLTGSKGSGKSTLFAALGGNTFPGIITWAVPGESVYLKETATGHQARIGLYNLLNPGVENKMQPISFGFAAVGIPALHRCAANSSEWIALDEIGYLECSCPEYCGALLHLFEKKHILATVRKQQLPFLQSLLTREDVFVVDLDQPFPNTGLVIMASGLGRRFGGNKLLTPFCGKPMMQWILDTSEGIFTHRVVVTRSEKAAAFCREQGVETILHTLPHRSDTVRLGLEAIGTNIWQCMFCPADQPLLQSETLRLLALSAANTPGTIWRPSADGQPGAPILFPKSLFPELQALPEGKGGGYVAAQHPELVRLLPIADARELWDIDTPEDLQRVENASFNPYM